LVDGLAARIVRSDGGSFLLVGYRGVGKTSVVNAIADAVALKMRSGQNGTEPADLITLSFALTRNIPPTNLLHQMINSIRLELIRQHLFERIAPQLRRELDLAALRTAVNLTGKGEEERKSNLGLTIGSIPYISKLEFGGQQLRRDLLEAAFLPYEQCAAEQDVVRLARALASDGSLTLSRADKFRSLFRLNRNVRRLRLMFVFDELDKLEQSSDQDPVTTFNDILKDLKTLLTTSGVTFLFVAGRGIHDAWQQDMQRGDSLYESVFSHIEYIPALWQLSDELCNQLLKPILLPDSRTHRHLANFKEYLAFSGRGIPRRTLQALQKFVQIDENGRASLVFQETDLRRFQCIAELEKYVKVCGRTLLDRRGGRSELDRLDNDGLALRYLTDWIIDSGQTPFGMAELSEACNRLNQLVAPRDDASGVVPRELVGALESAGVLEAAFGADKLLSAVVYAESPVKKWCVTRRRLIELGRELTSTVSTYAVGQSIAGRYLVNRLISRGGSSIVYETIDQISEQVVAVKCIIPGSFGNPNITRWLCQNERDVVSHLRHPSIPKLIGAELDHVIPFLVMEMAAGAPLDRLLRDRRRWDWEVVVVLMQEILAVLDYIHTQGVIWGDLKPGNIVVENSKMVRLVDFGAARFISGVNEPDGIPVIGTPQFMAPECLEGAKPSVISDIYSAGVLLYQITTGVLPFVGDGMKEVLHEIQNKAPTPPGSLFDMPRELEATILQCLELEPKRRFQTVKELVCALPQGAFDPARDAIRTMVSSHPGRESGRVFGTQAATQPVEIDGEVLSGDIPTGEPLATVDRERHWLRDESRILVYSKASDIQLDSELLLDTIEPSRRQFLLVKGISARIGRSSDNEIRIEDDLVSRYHARLEFQNGVWLIRALNPLNEILVNGIPVDESCEIGPDTVIQIGKTQIRINAGNGTIVPKGDRLPEELKELTLRNGVIVPASVQIRSRLRVYLTGHDDIGPFDILFDRPLLVGTDPACDICVRNDGEVSSKHCWVSEKAEGILVQDNSRVGTRVNGELISGSELAGPDLILEVGRTKLRLQVIPGVPGG
jgi:serine/threonine-protein kinase